MELELERTFRENRGKIIFGKEPIKESRDCKEHTSNVKIAYELIPEPKERINGTKYFFRTSKIFFKNQEPKYEFGLITCTINELETEYNANYKIMDSASSLNVAVAYELKLKTDFNKKRHISMYLQNLKAKVEDNDFGNGLYLYDMVVRDDKDAILLNE